MSMVFVICCSDVSLVTYKNDDSPCNSELATQLSEEIADVTFNFFARLITLYARATITG